VLLEEIYAVRILFLCLLSSQAAVGVVEQQHAAFMLLSRTRGDWLHKINNQRLQVGSALSGEARARRKKPPVADMSAQMDLLRSLSFV
jgi:hypothetical protein